MELSPRLRCIAKEVPKGARFADVGTDHAYLPVRLLQTGKISCAIASDIRSGPLERARETARRFDMSAYISFRLCDGLTGIRANEVDTVAIAGMGGETIAAILEAAPWTGNGEHLFLLQPMSSIPELRVWLQEHCFCIGQEHIVADRKKYYIIMTVRAGTAPYLTVGERWAGRQWRGMEAPLRADYLHDLERRVMRALGGLTRSASPQNDLRREELAAVAADLSNMKKEWQAWQR